MPNSLSRSDERNCKKHLRSNDRHRRSLGGANALHMNRGLREDHSALRVLTCPRMRIEEDLRDPNQQSDVVLDPIA